MYNVYEMISSNFHIVQMQKKLKGKKWDFMTASLFRSIYTGDSTVYIQYINLCDIFQKFEILPIHSIFFIHFPTFSNFKAFFR